MIIFMHQPICLRPVCPQLCSILLLSHATLHSKLYTKLLIIFNFAFPPVLGRIPWRPARLCRSTVNQRIGMKFGSAFKAPLKSSLHKSLYSLRVYLNTTVWCGKKHPLRQLNKFEYASEFIKAWSKEKAG